ncbi:MAG: ribose-phosphate pyrophosphokinase [Bacteroidetes bacterium]|jgi:ribose-phosphate pyrophosphokinase|nr:ribose-phosphate pyrophosphokinase [Bacteroidota bacterium]
MPSRFNPIKIFSGGKNTALAKQIANDYGLSLGQSAINYFSDGEFQPEINETVRGCDVFFIKSLVPPADNLLELLLYIDAAKRASAHYITAVIPYFGYARQDRKDKPRVPISAKLIANLLAAAGVSRIMTMDLHAPQIQGFFDIPVDHLDSSTVFIPYIKQLNLENPVIGAPDMGGSKRARFFANPLHADLVICDKHRKRANQVEEMHLIGDVDGRHVIIVDDMIDTGGTIVRAAAMMKEKGALSVRAFCTHPVLSGDAHERIAHSVLEELVVCDTIPLTQENPKIKVLSVSKLFANAIHNVYEYQSISSLFEFGDE